MILSAVLVTSSQVSVEVPNSASVYSDCGPRTVVDVVFQAVIGRTSDGTPVVFERYLVSQTIASIVMERLPDPLMNSNIGECANTAAAAGYDAFEFSSGTCTAIKLSYALRCEEVSGSLVYVSELFDGGSGELKIFTDEVTGVTVQCISLIVDVSKMLESTLSVNENDLQPTLGKAAWKHSDGNIYTFPMDYIDVANCVIPNTCDSFLFYNRDPSPSNVTSPLYFTDYCGGTMPGPIDYGQLILSHRGLGCEYMPDELLENDCVVKIEYAYLCLCRSSVHSFDSCDGLSLFLEAFSDGAVAYSKELCNPSMPEFTATTPYTYQIRLSLTKPNRLGFIFGYLIFDG